MVFRVHSSMEQKVEKYWEKVEKIGKKMETLKKVEEKKLWEKFGKF